MNTKSLLLFGAGIFYLQVISRALVYGCMLAQSGQRIFSLSCWQSAGLQPLHHAAFRYHSILLYPTVPLYKTTTLALHEAGVVVFYGFAERIDGKPMMSRPIPVKMGLKPACCKLSSNLSCNLPFKQPVIEAGRRPGTF
ncbi:hypothetical protein B5G28_05270 [Faecalibacterium sp. An77]|uniref:hypothetical protein n=1 Tax=Faecalibacterium sp. An77 TaxID=1965655 RepID=UPI000B37521B|nr:hypothetical protein [Faecalibacterium sp. An77]OUN39418.1 hypothetical protein B5G28_05270 [Faecalibacterium sp. An77]